MVTCAIALRKDDILDGQFIAGPLHEEQGILYAEIDPQRMRGSRWNLDVAGHYARPDVFQLTVHKEPRPMIAVEEGPAVEARNEAHDHLMTRSHSVPT